MLFDVQIVYGESDDSNASADEVENNAGDKVAKDNTSSVDRFIGENDQDDEETIYGIESP